MCVHRFQKCLRTRMRDRPEILHQITMRHANSSVSEGDRARCFVGLDTDFQWQVRLINLFPGGLQEPEFLKCIRGIGNQFANENLFIGVERVNDNVQQLLNFGLKMMFFDAHNSLPLGRKNSARSSSCSSTWPRRRPLRKAASSPEKNHEIS